MTTVAITGANGFVGRTLCKYLLKEGCAVRAIVRGGHVPEELRLSKLHLVEVAALRDGPELRSALRGSRVVVHLAGLAHAFPTPSAAQFDQVNHDATVAVARSTAAVNATRLIMLSTIKVNGESTYTKAFQADDLPAPQDDYGRSKLKAEIALVRLSAELGFEPVIIRPPLVYGPGVRANFARLVNFVDRGLPLPFGAVQNRRTMVNLWNLNDLIKVALEHPAAAGQTLLAGDDRSISTPELIQYIATALERKPRLMSVPPSWIRWGIKVAGKEELADRLLDSLEVSIGQTSRLLDWTPSVSVEDGISRTVLALRRNQPE